MYWLLPDELLPTLVIILAIGLIVGMIRPRTLGSVLRTICLCLLIGPFIESFISSLPAWIAIVMMLLIGLFLIRWMLQAVLGAEAAGHVIGSFVVWAIRGLLCIAFLPVRMMFRLVGFGARRIFGV